MTKQNYMICNSAEDDSTIYMELDENEVQIFEDLFNKLNGAKNRYAPTITMCLVPHKPETRKVWTMTYRPFTMGGDTNQAIFTIVPIIEKKTIRGFDFFSFKTPRGSFKICEAKTGGIVGDSFDDIENIINDAPIEMLLKQIDDAKPYAASAEEHTNEEFFKLYRY